MKTSFMHVRFPIDPDLPPKGKNISAQGGVTVAYTQMPDDTFVYAVAICNDRDVYNKRYGRMKAAGRLKSVDFRHVSDRTSKNHFLEDLDEYYSLMSR